MADERTDHHGVSAVDDLEGFLERARSGDDEAWNELVVRLRPYVLKVALSLLGQTREDDASDVAQDVFFKAHRNFCQFEGHARITTWLYRITYNCCQDLFRKHPQRRVMVEIDDPAVEEGHWAPPSEVVVDVVEDLTRRRQLGAIFKECLGQLPDTERKVLIMQNYQDLTTQEMSRRLGWPIGTVKTRLRNAKTRMRDLVTQYGLTAEA